MRSIGLFSLLFFSIVANANDSDGTCSVTYRPKTNETAFAAVGSSLKIADRTCLSNVLIIPFDTESGAVTIPQGEYPSIGQKDGKVLFSVNNTSGMMADSCFFCDPIEYLLIDRKRPKTLCSLSKLNLESCANDNSISYTVTQKSHTDLGQCTPSLVYFGRQGSVLKFAVNDCNSISKPTLTYDLTLGRVIRFLDDRYSVINADNQGIYYRRIGKSELKNNDVVPETIETTDAGSKNNTVEIASTNLKEKIN